MKEAILTGISIELRCSWCYVPESLHKGPDFGHSFKRPRGKKATTQREAAALCPHGLFADESCADCGRIGVKEMISRNREPLFPMDHIPHTKLLNMKEKLFAALKARGITVREHPYRMIGEDGFNGATCFPKDPMTSRDFTFERAVNAIVSDAKDGIVDLSCREELSEPQFLMITYKWQSPCSAQSA